MIPTAVSERYRSDTFRNCKMKAPTTNSLKRCFREVIQRLKYSMIISKINDCVQSKYIIDIEEVVYFC